MKDDKQQEMDRGMQIAGTLADHLMATGSYWVEMGFFVDGHEFLVTVERSKREQVSPLARMPEPVPKAPYAIEPLPVNHSGRQTISTSE